MCTPALGPFFLNVLLYRSCFSGNPGILHLRDQLEVVQDPQGDLRGGGAGLSQVQVVGIMAQKTDLSNILLK